MFHERLKEKRIKSKKKQKDLAEYLNISPQSISKWEKGEAFPSLEYLPKIAKFYKCDINSFFEEDQASKEKKQEKLEKCANGILDILMKNLQNKSKPRTCSIKKYDEFFEVAKSVLVMNEDENKLIKYFADNKDVTESISYVFILIIRRQGVSVSGLQRDLNIAFPKAMRIADGLEEIGVVFPYNDKGARKINYEQILRLKSFIE
jgi:transcriptional regulator with XRE-family HTH domain